MWAKNLLFVAVLVGGAVALRASLFPVGSKQRQVNFDAHPAQADDFRATVAAVNAAFRAEWKGAKLEVAPPANDLAVMRRLSLGLTGTVPSLEEVRQFEAQQPGERLDGWANHLVNDRRFADYFAERMARAYVGTEDGPLIAYRKRRFLAWLADEFANNTPYSDVVSRMIAQQGLNTDKPAVNFVASAYDDAKKAPDADKLTIRVSRAFLGLRLDCAQCHDHFLEPAWKQAHFQSLAAFFGQTKQAITNVRDKTAQEIEFELRDAAEKKKSDPGSEMRDAEKKLDIAPAVPLLPELLPNTGTRRERLAAWVTHKDNVYFARATVNRVWAMMTGRPLLKRIEAQTLDETGPAALDILAKDFAAHGHDLKRLIRLIAATEVYRLDSAADFEITDAHDKAWAAFPLTRLRPEQVIGTVIQASSATTIDQRSHIVTRAKRYFNERDFVQRYGDADDDEFAKAHGTIPQRLLMMNGDLVDGRAREELLNASSQIALFARDDAAAVETAYLSVLTRRPTPAESAHFAARLSGTTNEERRRRVADLYWTLFNSTELSFNH
jgi:hypothetical protein